MMNKIRKFLRIVLVMIVGLMFCQTAWTQNRSDRALINAARGVSGDDFAFTTNTSQGARVYSVNRANARMLDAIDQGLTDLFAVAEKNGYRKRLNYSDYTIFIAKADRTTNADKNYSPDIAIGAAQYAGSVYDQGGYIYAAGIVLAYNPCAFVFAEHTKDFGRVSEIVRYEGEHLILYHNDRQLYRQTADHSRGGGHPILK